MLDTGVDLDHPLLDGRLDPGYDAVADDDDPARRAPARRSETSGTALAGVLVAAGERVLPIRIAGAQATRAGRGHRGRRGHRPADRGLERAVDPDGDGATDDHAPVALIGATRPTPASSAPRRREAIRGATRLGTLVVAPAGGEGNAAGLGGVAGSPATAPDAIGAAALAAPAALARLDLTVGGADAAGPRSCSRARRRAPAASARPARSRRDAAEQLAAATSATGSPSSGPVTRRLARAAAAAAAGARAVLLADPRPAARSRRSPPAASPCPCSASPARPPRPC